MFLIYTRQSDFSIGRLDNTSLESCNTVEQNITHWAYCPALTSTILDPNSSRHSWLTCRVIHAVMFFSASVPSWVSHVFVISWSCSIGWSLFRKIPILCPNCFSFISDPFGLKMHRCHECSILFLENSRLNCVLGIQDWSAAPCNIAASLRYGKNRQVWAVWTWGVRRVSIRCRMTVVLCEHIRSLVKDWKDNDTKCRENNWNELNGARLIVVFW